MKRKMKRKARGEGGVDKRKSLIRRSGFLCGYSRSRTDDPLLAKQVL